MMLFSFCATSLALVLMASPEDRAQHDRKLGLGLTVPALALVVPTGVGLTVFAGRESDERRRIGLYAAGIATTMVGTGLFTASMVFWGRRNAYLRATEGRDPWPFGIGATAGYLSAAGVGAVLTGLGSYALVFQPGDGYATRKEKLRRGLALAGVIVGGNLMFFGGFLGGFSLGHHLYRRDTTSALAIGFSLTGPPVSGRF